MRTLILLVGVALLSSTYSLGQGLDKRNSIWLFGNQVGIDFTKSPPVAITTSAMRTTEGCVSVADTAGKLLFYSNGVSIYNRLNQLMPNGTGLLGGVSSSNSCLAIPVPGTSTKYYLVTTESRYGLTYSVIDMSLNNGLGGLTLKNEPIYGQAGEKMAYTYQANNDGYWLLSHALNRANKFIAFKVSATGISTTPVVSEIGFSIPDDDIGYMRISPDGKHIAMAGYDNNFFGYIQIGDFNACDGTVTNVRILKAFEPVSTYYGVEFSPNNKLLYVSTHTYNSINAGLFQYKIASTKDSMLASEYLRVLPVDSGTKQGNALQIGPDGALYWCLDPSSYLTRIPFPDSIGPASGIRLKAIFLEPDYTIRDIRQSQIGLPNRLLPLRSAPVQVAPNLTKTFGCAKDSVTLATTLGTAGFISWQLTLNDTQVPLPSVPPSTYKLLLDSGRVKIKLTYAKICSVDSLITSFLIPACPKPPPPPPPPPLPDSVFIPNVFSPNADTVNSVFKPYGTNIKESSGTIYNRWGRLVYSWSPPHTGWPGTNIPAGSFFYLLTVRFNSGKELTKKGWVEKVE